MEEEFELTYLIKELPKSFSKDCVCHEIRDIYIPETSEHSVLRIRKNGTKYEITKKELVSGTDSSHQTENTIPLTEEEFTALASIQGKRVRKIRYCYSEDDIEYEIDVFQDGLLGLIVVDVEFDSNKAKDTFIPPDWVLADVTQEKFIAGGVLCGKTYTDIENKLQRFDYIKVSI